MGEERKQKVVPEEDLNQLLDKADVVEEVDIERITGTLAIDGETHPPRELVKQEIKKLHARKSTRRKPNSKKPS